MYRNLDPWYKCDTKEWIVFALTLDQFVFSVRLHIEGEKLFVDMSEVFDAAMLWEERAKYILAHEAQISDFEDVIRFSTCFTIFFYHMGVRG